MASTARPTHPGPLHGLRVAVAFLTRLPVATGPVSDEDLRSASTWFPLVGLLVAGVEAGVRLAAGLVLPPLPAAVIAVAAAIAVTGAFHEDGLADTFDGLWGGWTPEERRRIMRDSRLGTYGAAALLLAVVLRLTLVAELDGWSVVRGLAAAHVISRAAILVAVRLGPAVARTDGRGARLAAPVQGRDVVPPAVVTVAAIAALGWLGAVVATASLAVTVAVRELARRRVGGITGDLLGATQQLVLLTVLVVVVAASVTVGG